MGRTPSRAGLRRGLLAIAAIVAMTGVCDAKIVKPEEKEQPLKIKPDNDRRFDYYTYGLYPPYGVMPGQIYRPFNPSLGTMAMTRSILRDATIMRLMSRTERGAVETGRKRFWMRGRLSGVVTPTDTFVNEAGLTCRSFNHSVRLDGSEQTVEGAGCKQADGTWTVAENKIGGDKISGTVSQTTAD